MAGDSDFVTLHRDLRERLAQAMQQRGWARSDHQAPNTLEAAMPDRPGGLLLVAPKLSLGSYERAARDGFAAIADYIQDAEFIRGRGRPRLEERLPLVVSATVGVTCPPVAQLLQALGADRQNPGRDRELVELVTGGERATFEVASPDEAPAAVAALVELVDRHAAAFAHAGASTDAFVAELEGDRGDLDYAREQVPVLLAVAGRTDEAREALRHYRANPPRGWRERRRYRAFAEHLEQHLDRQ